MARTIRRQPFTVSTSNNAKQQFFNQVQFKGLCTDKNEITVDAQSFSDVNNMFVDQSGVLTSRPPVKFADGEYNIIDERTFGLYKLRLYKLVRGNSLVFLLRCVSHNTISDEANERYAQYSWWIENNPLGQFDSPKVSYAQVEDKIYIWFAGIDFLALNTVGEMRNGEKFLYFEDGAKYIYIPIHQQIVNSVESELESKNSLTGKYYKRYLYSLLSNVDFSELIGKQVSVNLNKNEGTKHLYDITINGDFDREVLLYPKTPVSSVDEIQVVNTPRADVILKYDTVSHAISVSFGGDYFRTLPPLVDTIIGRPYLTDDGLCVVVFTRDYVYVCKLVSQESADFTELSDVMEWNRINTNTPIESVVGFSGTSGNGIGIVRISNDTFYIAIIGEDSVDFYVLAYFKNSVLAHNLFPDDAKFKFSWKQTGDRLELLFLTNVYLEREMHFYNQFLYVSYDLTSLGINSIYNYNISETISDTQIENWDLMLLDTSAIFVGTYDHFFESRDIYYRFSRSKGSSPFLHDPFIYENREYMSDRFRVDRDGNYITDKYVYTSGVITPLPLNIGANIIPLYRNNDANWYLIDNKIWTTSFADDVILELDVLVEGSATLTPPDYYALLDTGYFAYETLNGEYLLEVLENRRDDTTKLLYMPKNQEQKFANKITALHPLSDSQLGIFTNDGIWYISILQNDDGTVLYTQPIRSKLPVKLRDGDEVVTALDGQAIIFPVVRGIVALAPQDFIATTEKTLSYLTDTIQEKYQRFYNGGVDTLLLADKYNPEVKISIYNYWILFYKHLDREILALDTRTGSWWTWSVQYPILSLSVDTQLNLLMQIDFNPKKRQTSLRGVSFVLADTGFDSEKYYDDIVDESIRGNYTILDDGSSIIHYASPQISWQFTSQPLHFEAINNYKAVKAMSMNLKGDDVNAKLYTKAFRDMYHPEQDDLVEIRINELRTFVKRFNLIHVTNFQYRVENNTDADVQHQFQLNSLSIKYEVKERIR